MMAFDQDQIVSLLGTACDAPPAAVDAIQLHGLRALLGNAPATVAELATRSGLASSEIRAGMDGLRQAGRIEIDGDRVVGVGGLTTTVTVHRLALPDANMHTWCALDAIGIPVAMGMDAQMSTTCPRCGSQLRVSVHAGGARCELPVVLLCPTAPCTDVRVDFCSSANLFCNTDHLKAWRSSHPSVEGEELDLEATVELGRAMWARHSPEPGLI